VTYAGLVRALGAEVGKATRELRADAEREAAARVEAARAQATAERAQAIARADAEVGAAAKRALARAALAEERESLLLERRMLAEVESAARERLAVLEDARVLERLRAEVLAEAGGAAIEWRGAHATLEGRIVLDNSLASRLTKAWPSLEREVAGLLFGGGDGAL
jgi:vacuolar-type H+-ATPase subunit E/Vma4